MFKASFPFPLLTKVAALYNQTCLLLLTDTSPLSLLTYLDYTCWSSRSGEQHGGLLQVQLHVDCVRESGTEGARTRRFVQRWHESDVGFLGARAWKQFWEQSGCVWSCSWSLFTFILHFSLLGARPLLSQDYKSLVFLICFYSQPKDMKLKSKLCDQIVWLNERPCLQSP